MSTRRRIDAAKLRNKVSYYLSITLFFFFSLISVQISQAANQDLSLLMPNQVVPSTLQGCASPPVNPIVAENCLPSTSDWFVETTSTNISGFASSTSVNKGEKITFYVNTQPASQFDMNIFRIGYYGGMGGRLMQVIPKQLGVKQPECIVNYSTGLTNCGNWKPTYTLTIPDDWTSGVYVTVLTLPDGGKNYLIFVVRDDDRDAPILYQQSTSTYQAYNAYGGKSLYNFNSGICLTIAEMPRAVAVSFNRPYLMPLGMQDYNMFQYAEYPFVSWLEQQGYDVVYSTSVDTHNSGKTGAHNELRDHKVFLVSGHDEYWSPEMRNAITDARDNGVNLGFFSSNVGYWQVRLQPDPLSGEPDRMMIGYKTTESGPADPSGTPTGTSRDPLGANNPENSLVGIQYMGDNDDKSFPLRISSLEAKDDLYRHTSLQQMPDNSYIDIGNSLVGWEWDTTFDNGHSPENLTVLASSPTSGALLTDAGRYYEAGIGQSQVIRYKAPSGSMVFSTGTNLWSFGLAIREPNPIIQQVTYNVLSDMGVQPATPSSSLIMDTNQTPDAVTKPLEPIISNPDTKTPVISDMRLSVEGSKVTFYWNTDKPTTSVIWMRISKDSERLVEFPPANLVRHYYADSNLQTSHQATIDNLVPNAGYSYNIFASDEQRNTTISPDTAFNTASDSLVSSLKTTIKPITRAANCWVQANQTGSIIVAILGIVIAILLITPSIILFRRRRMALSRA